MGEFSANGCDAEGTSGSSVSLTCASLSESYHHGDHRRFDLCDDIRESRLFYFTLCAAPAETPAVWEWRLSGNDDTAWCLSKLALVIRQIGPVLATSQMAARSGYATMKKSRGTPSSRLHNVRSNAGTIKDHTPRHDSSRKNFQQGDLKCLWSR